MVQNFSKDICPKMNAKSGLDLDLAFYDAAIQVFTNPSLPAGCNTRSVFKCSLTGLNSEFSFSTCYLTKVKEPVCPTIYPQLERE